MNEYAFELIWYGQARLRHNRSGCTLILRRGVRYGQVLLFGIDDEFLVDGKPFRGFGRYQIRRHGSLRIERGTARAVLRRDETGSQRYRLAAPALDWDFWRLAPILPPTHRLNSDDRDI